MTLPIVVCPTDTPGLYETENTISAVRRRVSSWEQLRCVGCLQLLETPSYEHWYIGCDTYCKNCVVVADQEN